MNKHTIDGTLQDAAGRVEGALGALSNDAELELRGKARQLGGKTEAAAGDAMDAARNLVSDKPITSVLLTAGFAFLLGLYWAGRRSD